MKKLLPLIFLSLLFVFSCSKDDDCDTSNVTYTNSIASILNNSCAASGCHSAAEAMTTGSLANYDDAVLFANFGRMIGAINHSEGFGAMPLGGDKLDDCSIDKIEAWIDAGTPQ